MSEHKHGPDCGHNHSHNHAPMPKITTKHVVWATVTTAVVGVGAYFISKFGEASAIKVTPETPSNTWQNRIADDKSAEKSRQ